MISIDSSVSQGNLEVTRFVESEARRMGLHVELQNEFDGGLEQANIIIRPLAGKPSQELLFQNHLDTPDPGHFQLWADNSHNPFEAVIKENKIYGLGTADVKLDFLCKLQALASFIGIEAWKCPPVLVGTFGEESGMQGMLKLIRRQKVNAKMALVGEPSNLKLITAAKGFAVIEIRVPFSQSELAYKQDHDLRESTSTQSRIFRGTSAHSSTPHLGESAIIKLFEFLRDLPEGIAILQIDGGTASNVIPSNAMLELDTVSHIQNPIKHKILRIYDGIKDLENEFLKFKDPDFSPPYPTLSIGTVRTSDDSILMSGNCRVPPVISQSIYELWMRKIQNVCEEQGAQFRILDYKKPFRTPNESSLVKVCLEEMEHAGISPQVSTQASTNEASLLSRVGIDCVCFGPGPREGNIHTPQEHVSLGDLEKATDFYKRIIERLCL
jgi:acetylornithine deacetylase/succinyl-diaminopimelate desuccinylase-like protein